jgi:hypothetical protein
MTSITIPDSVRDFLLQAHERAIIRDPAGVVLGFYAPVEPEPAHRNGRAPGLAEQTANESVLTVLRKVNEPVGLCNEAGSLIGHFAPVPPERAEFVASAFPLPDPAREREDPLVGLRAEFDMAAVEREMASNGKVFTLAEVYEHLLAITPEPKWRAHLQEKIARLKE